MKILIAILAIGCVPTVYIITIDAIGLVAEWRNERRYKRAWEKFGAEFGALSPQQLEIYKQVWNDSPDYYRHMHEDRDRYFKMRWQHGRTKDV